MTLFQATAIILGAKIGTTVTGLLVSLSSIKADVVFSSFAIIGVFMMMFSKKDKVQKIGAILTGFGLIFVGLDVMSASFRIPSINEAFKRLFASIDFPLLLILVGTLFTALIQSSSAATGIIIIMIGAEGTLSLAQALYLVIGANIGTGITGIIAGIGASTDAKRVSFIHVFTAIIGAVFIGAIVWIFQPYVINVFQKLIPSAEWQVSIFHIIFNVINTFCLIPFINPLIKLSKMAIKDKPQKQVIDNKNRLKYIDDRLLSTPAIAVAQVIKETDFMANLAKNNLEKAMESIFNQDISSKDEILKTEEHINFTNYAIAKYLIKIAGQQITAKDEKTVGTLHHVIDDIERIGDHAQNFIEQAEKMKKEQIQFSDEAITELRQMYNKVNLMFDLSINVFNHNDTTKLPEISELENQVDEYKVKLGNQHIERLNCGKCAVEKGTYYFALTSALERIADHLINIAYSINNPTGSQRQAKINH